LEVGVGQGKSAEGPEFVKKGLAGDVAMVAGRTEHVDDALEGTGIRAVDDGGLHRGLLVFRDEKILSKLTSEEKRREQQPIVVLLTPDGAKRYYNYYFNYYS
jgi:hypothetical protein